MVLIFIPSKGKAIPSQTPTTDLLKGVREYTMFVEPEEGRRIQETTRACRFHRGERFKNR
jgi:hypothetical protein